MSLIAKVNATSFIDKLIFQLSEIEIVIDEMLNNSTVFYSNPNDNDDGFIFIGVSVYHWGTKDEKTQITAKEKYENFFNGFELLLQKAMPEYRKKIDKAHKKITLFIEQNDKSAPASINGGKLELRNQTQIFKDFLNLFKSEGQVLLIPDTNSLIQFPDPKSYQKVTDGPFVFTIMPTVLSELDKLKTMHRDTEFREKVKSIIKRLKGYRNQGDVLKGVIVDKTIVVKMVATEPDFSKTLKWIDPNNADDRIIANALNMQVLNPSDKVMLITSDINLQNKAQLAILNCIDTDDLE